MNSFSGMLIFFALEVMIFQACNAVDALHDINRSIQSNTAGCR